MKMRKIEINQIEGFKLGNAEDFEAGTGCTVIICEEGAVAGVDVRGGAPATRETDLLKSENTVEGINAVVLSGGSAFGLEAASGVMRVLSSNGVGIRVGEMSVPIVCGASLYDLAVAKPDAFPDVSMGKKACRNAYRNIFRNGNFGAGTGATCGKIRGMERAMKTGLGTYAVGDDYLQVGAVTAVNALGDIYNGAGTIIAGLRTKSGDSIKGTVRSYRGRVHNAYEETWDEKSVKKQKSSKRSSDGILETVADMSDIAAAMKAAFESEKLTQLEKNFIPVVPETYPEPAISAQGAPQKADYSDAAAKVTEKAAELAASSYESEPEVSAHHVQQEHMAETVREAVNVSDITEALSHDEVMYADTTAEPEVTEEPENEAAEETVPEEAPKEFSNDVTTEEPVEELTEDYTETAESDQEEYPDIPDDVLDEYAGIDFESYSEEPEKDGETGEYDCIFDTEPQPYTAESTPLSSLPTIEIISKEELLKNNSRPGQEPESYETYDDDDSDADMGYDIPFNTVISCVITNAKLTKPQANKLAAILHDAYARAIRPTHTTMDGDTIFVMATGKQEVDFDAFAALATDVLQYAIIDGAESAKSAYGLPAARDMAVQE